MTLHKKNHITRTLLAVSMLAMSGGALAAQVPPGTQLAEKQELVRNNGSEPASLDPHKVESDVEFNIISDLFEGQRGRSSRDWRNAGKTKTTCYGPFIYAPV